MSEALKDAPEALHDLVRLTTAGVACDGLESLNADLLAAACPNLNSIGREVRDQAEFALEHGVDALLNSPDLLCGL